jgi:hypothetical protein
VARAMHNSYRLGGVGETKEGGVVGRHATRSLLGSWGIILAAAVGFAQPPAATLDELTTRVVAGERVVVTNRDGVRASGRLGLEAGTLVLQTAEGSQRLAAADVFEVRRQPDSVVNGALWGTLIGAGAGLAVGLAIDASRGEGTWLAPVITAAGAGGGALAGLIGDATRPHADVLFRAGGTESDLAVQPLISPGRLSLHAAFRF